MPSIMKYIQPKVKEKNHVWYVYENIYLSFIAIYINILKKH